MTRIVALDGRTMASDDVAWGPIRALGELTVYERTPAAEMVARCAGAQVVVTNKAPFNDATLAALPDLKLIAVTATGYNIVDVPAARALGVTVCNVPEYATAATAQFTIAMLLELCHRVGLHAQSVAAGQWTSSPDFAYTLTPQMELDGRTLGVIGFGRIGRRVGRIAHALGMRVVAVRRPSSPAAEPWFSWGDLDEVMETCDVLSLHCPQTAQNTGMINRALLRRMKRSALLVNAARGALVVEEDLAEALGERWIAGAAVDVVSAEPIRADNPLLTAPNLLITPHMAWMALDARKRLMRVTAENIAAFLAGRAVNVVS